MKRSLFASLAVTLALIAALGVVLTASAGGLTFGPKTDYATASPASYNFNLHDVVAADFNRDGRLDLAAVNAGGGYSANGYDETGSNFAAYPGSLTLLTGDGLGSFTRTFTLTVGAQAPLAVVAADFNRDGKLDVSLAMSNTRSIDTFLGDGLGGFTLAYSVTTGAGTRPLDLAVGDFNKDGRPDLIVAADKQNYVSVLLGVEGGFTVTALNMWALDSSINIFNPLSVAVGDFNQDGNDDFVVVPDQGSGVPVIKGNGNGAFAYLTQLGAGSNPRGVATGDVNADGYLDVVLGTTANVPGGYFLGQSGGIDATKHTYGTNTRPVAVAFADINGDSFPDIVATAVYDGKVNVLLGDGAGAFGNATSFAASSTPLALAIGDFNRDGKPDVAAASKYYAVINVLLNTTTWKSVGAYNPPVNYNTGAAYSFALSQGDFTGDGKLDLAASQMTGASLRLFDGSSSGAFVENKTLSAVGEVKGSATGDFNRDGRLDLALARNDGKVLIVTNTVASNLMVGPTYVVAATGLSGIAAGDLNGDGALDLVATNPGNNEGNQIGVLLNNGAGVFSPTAIYTVETAPRYVALADFDQDGRLDVAVSNYVSNTLSLLRNEGAGVLGAATTLTGTTQATGLAAQDFDRDGDPDLAVGGNSIIRILLNDGAGAFPVADRKTRSVTGQVAPLVAADLNRDGILDLVAGAEQSTGSPVNLVLGVGDGTFGATTIYTGVSNSLRVPAVVVGDYNRDGGPDLAFIQPVSSAPFTQLSTRLSQLLEPPTITSTNSATFSVGSAGVFTLTTTGLPTVTGWSRSGALPGGVTFVTSTDGTATLAGAPDVGGGGRYALVFTATNGVPPAAVQPFTLTVTEAPAFTSGDRFTATLGNFAAFTVTVAGYPTPTVAYTGTLPGGVSFNPATRVFSGTPAAGTIGMYPLILTAANGLTPAATQPFTLVVSGPQIEVTKTVLPATDAPYNGIVTYTIVAANTGLLTDPSVWLTDTLPVSAPFAAWVTQPAGAQQQANVITWNGTIAAGAAVTFTFQATNTVGNATVVTNSVHYSGAVQAGAVSRAYTAVNACYVAGSGNWSTAFSGCTSPGAKRVIPAGVTVTLDMDVALDGNLEVLGVFVANGKTVTLTGARAQTLKGNPLTFYNLIVNKTNKTDTVTISGKLRVSKKLTLTKGKLVSASDYADIEIEADGELELTSDITVGGSFTNTGALTTNGHAISFDGGVEQQLVLNTITLFDDLTVYTGTTLIEAVTDDNALIQGTLTNYGTIRKTQPTTSPDAYNFGLAGESAGADIDITVTTLGSLSALQVDRIDAAHANPPAGQTTAVYWTITPTGAGYTAELTLPHAGVTDATACRYGVGEGVWACAYSAHDATTVTRSGVTAFSDWAVFASQTTTTTLAPAGPVVFGQPVTLTVSVAPVITGAVQFFAGGAPLGAGQSLVNGAALIVTTTLPVGAHPITATYGGYNHYAPSLAAPITLTVGKASAGAELASVPAPASFGQPVVFTATVSATPPGAGTPAGVVTFTVDAAPHPATLVNGVATYQATNLAVGQHPVTASYGGDGNFLPATSAVYTQTVNKAETTTTLVLAPNPAMVGTNVVYTATVGVKTAEASIQLLPSGPTGSVRFTDTTGTVDLTGALSSGVAIVSGGAIPAGVYTVTATYQGSNSYQGSDADAAVLVVEKYATMTGLTSNGTPRFVDATLSFTVAVAEASVTQVGILSPAQVPTGTVSIADSTGAISLTGALVDGRVALDAPWLPAGVYTVTASYLGNARYAASTSGAIVQVLQRHGTAAAVVVAPSTAFVGDTVNITATVVISEPVVQSGHAITGVVEFYANGSKLGEAALVSGQAQRSAPVTVAGAYTLTVRYLGNAVYAGSESNAGALTVVKRGSQTSLTAAPNPSLAGEVALFTATVAELAPSALAIAVLTPPTPTGEVVFVENSAEVGRGAIIDGAAYFTTSLLSVGDHAITAQYVGDGAFLPSASALYTQTVQPQPVAVNDAAGALQDNAVTIAVLANDIDPAGGGLTIVDLQQPAHGTVVAGADPHVLIYTPGPGFSGADSFAYAIADSNHNHDVGLVTVVVVAQQQTDAPPQIAPLDPTVAATVTFTSSTVAMDVEAPAGFITQTLSERDVFFLSYTPVLTPSQETQTPPDNFKFGNFEFDLTAYLNASPQHDIQFVQPVTLTLHYNPALLLGLDAATLGLYHWDGTTWSASGIVILSHDAATGVLAVAISHLSEFAFFAAAAPTALDPAPEPETQAALLYLPAVASNVTSQESSVMSQASPVTPDESQVTDDESRMTDDESPVTATLYLPVVTRE